MVYDFTELKVSLGGVVVADEVVEDYTKDLHDGQVCVLEECTQAHRLTVSAVGVAAFKTKLVQ